MRQILRLWHGLLLRALHVSLVSRMLLTVLSLQQFLALQLVRCYRLLFEYTMTIINYTTEFGIKVL